jgi:hypothetical protein
MLRSLATYAAAMLLLWPVSGVNAASAGTSDCKFRLGFEALEALLPAEVGACLDDEAYNPTTGDALQHSTGGLLVWRKLDNATAFTDGYRTWVNGPDGLQERLNSQRFTWEANPAGLPVVGAPPSHDCGATSGVGKVRTLCPPP